MKEQLEDYNDKLKLDLESKIDELEEKNNEIAQLNSIDQKNQGLIQVLIETRDNLEREIKTIRKNREIIDINSVSVGNAINIAERSNEISWNYFVNRYLNEISESKDLDVQSNDKTSAED